MNMPSYRIAGHLFPFAVLGGAMALFLLGLASPLTPSAGHPGPSAIGAFVIGPLVLSTVVAFRAECQLWRWAGFMEAALLLGVATWLLVTVL